MGRTQDYSRAYHLVHNYFFIFFSLLYLFYFDLIWKPTFTKNDSNMQNFSLENKDL